MNILAINPWIYDFAAYDFWLKPYGFLVILQFLKKRGINIEYIDCLDRKTTLATFGRGKYPSEIVKKPDIFNSIPRYFKRYGISLEEFDNEIKGKKFDYILITSSMTYWYPGINEVVKILKAKLPDTKIILGGTYATLCNSHAKSKTGCDFVFSNENLENFFEALGVNFNHAELYENLPAYEDFYAKLDYAVFRTSWGCPFNCNYCAIKKLFSGFLRLPETKIVNFIKKYANKGVRNFVLYDDAFLYEPDYAKNMLKKIDELQLNIAFHTPNALHLRFLDKELAVLLKNTGFVNPHFGLETLNASLQKLWGDKVNKHDLIKGIDMLKAAGFKNGEFSVYLLLGFPRQDLNDLRKDVEFLNSLGARVSLAEFSPVPGTALFKEYSREFNEPLLQNNSTFGFFQQDKIRDFWEIKNYVRELNKKLNVN